VTDPLLVRNGHDAHLGPERHTWFNVYREMFLQVVHDYNGIGDFRDLEYYEIEFFYEAMRASLRDATKPR